MTVKKAALHHAEAMEELRAWILARSKNLPPSKFAYLGPTMDLGTYYFWVGREPLDGEKISQKEGIGQKLASLKASQTELSQLGIKGVVPEELNRVAALLYQTHTSAHPDYRFVVKHFPGGDERVELTESQPVHFDKKSPIADFISAFNPVLNSGTPPWGIMLSHASYDLTQFPGLQNMKQPEIPDFIIQALRASNPALANASVLELFSQVPASMNPFINQYLREVKGYQGVTVSDWYYMQSATAFAQKLDFSSIANGQKAKPEDVKFIMAVTSGVDYMRAMLDVNSNSPFWREFKNHSPNEFAAFEDKMNDLILKTYNKVRSPSDPTFSIEDIRGASFKDKVSMMTNQIIPSDYQDLKGPLRTMGPIITEKNAVDQQDMWQHGSILSMQYRKNIVEHVTGLKFPDAPMKASEELGWLKNLMADERFKKAYDSINWEELSATVGGKPTEPARVTLRGQPDAPQKEKEEAPPPHQIPDTAKNLAPAHAR